MPNSRSQRVLQLIYQQRKHPEPSSIEKVYNQQKHSNTEINENNQSGILHFAEEQCASPLPPGAVKIQEEMREVWDAVFPVSDDNGVDSIIIFSHLIPSASIIVNLQHDDSINSPTQDVLINDAVVHSPAVSVYPYSPDTPDGNETPPQSSPLNKHRKCRDPFCSQHEDEYSSCPSVSATEVLSCHSSTAPDILRSNNVNHPGTHTTNNDLTCSSSECHVTVDAEDKTKPTRISETDTADDTFQLLGDIGAPLETLNNQDDCFSSLNPTLKLNSIPKYEDNSCKNLEELITKYEINDSVPICFSECELRCEALPYLTNAHSSKAIQSLHTSNESIDNVMYEQLLNLPFEEQHGDSNQREKQTCLYEDENDALVKSCANLYISFPTDETDTSSIYKDDGDYENKEIQRTIENINRRSKPLIKHIPNDDTLRIECDEKHSTGAVTNVKLQPSQKFDPIEAEEKHTDATSVSNWEDMYPGNDELEKKTLGENPKHSCCDVKIVHQTKEWSVLHNLVLEDLDHVIELYNFPSTFKTQDLVQLYYGAYQDSMYVKWCDDTHALLVLSTPAQAQRALQIKNDIIKSRPLSEGSKIALSIAGCTDLKPAMKRPPTTMQTARRLISTHLGTKIKFDKQALEEERKILNNAREQKRMERQNEKDAWEGNPRSTK